MHLKHFPLNTVPQILICHTFIIVYLKCFDFHCGKVFWSKDLEVCSLIFCFSWFLAYKVPLWSENILQMISIIWDLLNLHYDSAYNLFWCVSFTFEKNVYSKVTGCSVLHMSSWLSMVQISYILSIFFVWLVYQLL